MSEKLARWSYCGAWTLTLVAIVMRVFAMTRVGSEIVMGIGVPPRGLLMLAGLLFVGAIASVVVWPKTEEKSTEKAKSAKA